MCRLGVETHLRVPVWSCQTRRSKFVDRASTNEFDDIASQLPGLQERTLITQLRVECPSEGDSQSDLCHLRTDTAIIVSLKALGLVTAVQQT